MAQGVTQVASLTSTIQTRYDKEYYLYSAENPGVWAQFVKWGTPIPEDAGNGATINMAVYDELDPIESALAEIGDPAPQTMDDSSFEISPAEWGATFSKTKLASYKSRTPLAQIAPKLMAQNRVNTIDRVIRRAACGRGSSYPDFTLHIDGSAAMALLTATTSTDKVTYDFLMYLATMASSMGLEPWKNMGYLVLAHPLLVADLKSLTEWKSVGYYQDSENLYGTVEKPFTLAGLTFVPTRLGRVYLGAGTALHTATTLAAAAARGATTITVTSATNLAAGDWLTIGTTETESVNPGDNLEQVQVVSIASTVIFTIRGAGRGNNTGLRYDHAILEDVKEAWNVGAIPIIGKNSIHGVFGSDTGKYGKFFDPDPQDTLQRIKEWGWYWFGGLAVLKKKMLLGKVALTSYMPGTN